jgi:adenylosuccinate synthase
VSHPHAILIIDLAFGDCGKGTIVDFLARQTSAHTVVRFNGGPQAAHNVITPGGRHHTFAQFGSATFLPGVRTLLSRFMLIEPYALLNEAAHLEKIGVPDALGRLLIDARCPVITPAHQAANRLLEFSRGDAAHGTCGMGIGQAMQDLIDHPDLMLHAGDLRDRAVVISKLRAIRDLKVKQLRDILQSSQTHPRARQSVQTLLDPAWIEAAADNYAEVARHAHIASDATVQSTLCAPGTVIFEGAQGVLLDESYGFHPHTTWSTTTFANARTLLDEAGHTGRRTRVGVLRSYFTRHGSGPMVTEDASLSAHLPEPHNSDAGWAGRFRVGPFDAVAARYALAVAGPVDVLAMTHVDRLAQLPDRICTAYDMDEPLAPARPRGINGAFRWEGGKIVRIEPCMDSDLDWSEQRTQFLRRCRPAYVPVPRHDRDAFLRAVAEELHRRVDVISLGPRAGDKQFLSSHGFGFL